MFYEVFLLGNNIPGDISSCLSCNQIYSDVLKKNDPAI